MERRVTVTKFGEIEPAKPVTNKGAGSRVRRLITRDREGSDRLMLGVSVGDPYQEPISWSYDDVDEVYYMVSGEKLLQYEYPNGEKGEVRLRPGDACYLPRKVKYTSWNPGNIPYVIVYVTNPPLM